MSGVEFDDNQAQQLYAQIQQTNEATGFSKFLIDKSIVKDQQQANTIMTILACFAFALTAYVIYTYIL